MRACLKRKGWGYSSVRKVFALCSDASVRKREGVCKAVLRGRNMIRSHRGGISVTIPGCPLPPHATVLTGAVTSGWMCASWSWALLNHIQSGECH